MAAMSDPHINSYDIIFAKGGHVYSRYNASGSHHGGRHSDVEATGNKTAWYPTTSFEIRYGKVKDSIQ
jgi:hypothetical protein